MLEKAKFSNEQSQNETVSVIHRLTGLKRILHVAFMNLEFDGDLQTRINYS
jgi:hypothetical protein